MAHKQDHSTPQETQIQQQPTNLNQLADKIEKEEGITDEDKAKDKALKMFCNWNL